MGNQGKTVKKQRDKKYVFFIFPFWVEFLRRNFNYKYGNPISTFTSVLKSIGQGISLLIRLLEILLVWFELLRQTNFSVLTVRKNSYAQNNPSISSKTLVNLEKGFLHLQCMFRLQMWNQNGNMKKNVLFSPLFLYNLVLITHDATKSVNPSILR